MLKLFSLPALGAALGGFVGLRSGHNPYYSGPVSDHYDGVKFFNPSGQNGKGFKDLVRWRLADGKEEWPDEFPSPFRDRPPQRVEGAGLRVALVGHASFLIQTAGLNMLTDPVWSERCSPVSFAGPKRVNPPGIAFGDLPPIDAVLLTHNHYDHLDIDTLRRLVAAHPLRIVTPLGNDAILREAGIAAPIFAHDWGDRVRVSDAVHVHVEPAQHWSARGVLDRQRALWAAFVLETPAGAIYHVGDTGFGDGAQFSAIRAKHGEPLLAILPIGAFEPRWFMRDQHMNPDDAVRAFVATGARQALGHHWGTFKLTDEGIERPPEALVRALAEHGVAPERFRPLRPGEVWEAAAGA
ncbi:membrane protein [Alsobacter metallidurans]|uniref:Membrane protein n=2 Tax=Alsobacter metallidurans TaxID=340221 RepID=A0A917MJR7_9HYPH|nr:MBL fold metallo-hydrolase [Alsobacter metallidurans]GGH32945.1 membrane protein [Alsobacter metallidurans]